MALAKKPKKAKAKGVRYGVTPERFVEVWEASATVAEVMATLKMPKHACYSRASSYRAQDIPLKEMPRGNSNKLDVKKLAALTAKGKAAKK